MNVLSGRCEVSTAAKDKDHGDWAKEIKVAESEIFLFSFSF